MNESFLIGLIVMVQFVAFGGAVLFARIARSVGARRAIAVSLVVWTGVIVYAYGFLQTTTQAWIMGAVFALVLGGSQALSRSLFSRMIPTGREASYFGRFEIHSALSTSTRSDSMAVGCGRRSNRTGTPP